MPQVIITNACQVNFGDDRGGVHQDTGDMPTVSKEVGNALVRAGRALYVDKKDDPDKRGRDTASKEMIAAAQEMVKAKTKGEKPAADGKQGGGLLNNLLGGGK